MARYRGPKSKISRRFNDPIFGEDKALERKPYPPGAQGNNRRRGKQSEYAIQLLEKQKAKHTYGILERQFRNLFHVASSKKGVTGENLLQLCELRLDNIVYRMGISPTRRGARQLVTHKHITVNNKIVNIPSAKLKPGDVVAVREKSKALEAINASVNNNSCTVEWLSLDTRTLEGSVLNIPKREEISENINEQLIVELYSK